MNETTTAKDIDNGGKEYPSTITGASGLTAIPLDLKTYVATASLRWKRQTDPFAGMMEAFGHVPRVLQQAWQCLETGEHEWRDVPTEDAK
jgi:hypothetical protein